MLNKSNIVKTLRLAVDNPGIMLFILFIDLVFLVLLNGLLFATNMLYSLYQENYILMIVVGLLYAVILLLLYSFSKFLVLCLIRKSISKAKLSFSSFWRFLAMNAIFFFLLLLILLLAAGIVEFNVQEGLKKYIIDTMIALVLVIFYLFLNISHSLFSESPLVFSSIKSGFSSLVKVRLSLAVIAIAASGFAVYFGIAYILSLLLGEALTKAGSQQYNLFSVLVIVFTFIYFYALMAFNRLYIYLKLKFGNR